jgi:hypothetical protein
MRWAEHVARTGEMRNEYSTLIRKSEKGDHLENLWADKITILKLILQKQGVTLCTGFIWLTVGTNYGLLRSQS